MFLNDQALLRWGITAVAVAIVVGAVVVSKRRPIAVGEDNTGTPPAGGSPSDDDDSQRKLDEAVRQTAQDEGIPIATGEQNQQ
jgi:hypothetical protein